MKRTILLLTSVLFIAGCSNRTKQASDAPAASDDGLRGQLQLSGAFALYPMAIRWAEAFRALHPHVRIDISGGGAGKGMTDVLAGVVDIGMVSREIYPEEIAKGAFPIATVKDAVIPTVNAGNPQWEDIRKIGLRRDVAVRLWNKELSTWGEILGTSATTPVHVFSRSDACGAGETFAAWLGRKQEHLKATAVFGDPGVAAAVQKDKVGIGYNNIAYAYDQKTRKPFEGLAIFPIDVNDNGVIDPDEDFYETTETLIRAIHENRFPSPPARDLYLVTKGKPTRPLVVAFLEYVLNEGQTYAAETGYIGLSDEKLREEAGKLK
jgi:phosphate transport system substrate-binding protein